MGLCHIDRFVMVWGRLRLIDFLEENWWILGLLIIAWEYLTRGTLKPAAIAAKPTSGSTPVTTTNLPIRLTPGSGVTLSPSGSGRSPKATNFVNEDRPGYDSLSGITDDPGWGDNG